MKDEVIKILERWAKSLKKYGKLDQSSLVSDTDLMDHYIRNYWKRHKSFTREVSLCRSLAIKDSVDTGYFLQTLTNVIRKRSKREKVKKSDIGQHKRFEYETRALFNERIRFKNGLPLRNLDVTTEGNQDARKIRRIVEKRMCQAYFRQHKEHFRQKGNLDRHLMHRATSFQLFNIGQIDDAGNYKRYSSSHWKKKYDPVTGTIVFKKKVGYDTYEEAELAVDKIMKNKPKNSISWGIYLCPSCGKYHIGHQHLPIKTKAEDLYSLSVLDEVG